MWSKYFVVFCMALAIRSNLAHAEPLVLSDAELGITIELKDSRAGKPIVAITDREGTDFTSAVNEINKYISRNVLSCGDGVVAKAVDAYLVHCKWLGVELANAKIVPYNQIPGHDPEGISNRLLLLKANISYNGKSEEIFFINLEYIVKQTRAGKSIYSWFNSATVRTQDDYAFRRLDVSRLLSEISAECDIRPMTIWEADRKAGFNRLRDEDIPFDFSKCTTKELQQGLKNLAVQDPERDSNGIPDIGASIGNNLNQTASRQIRLELSRRL